MLRPSHRDGLANPISPNSPSFPPKAPPPSPSIKPNTPLPTPTTQKPPHIPLHPAKLDEATTLTLQMIEHGRQRLELRPAALLIWAMIDRLLVRRALDMLVEVSLLRELPVADVAFVARAVPGVA